MPRKGAHRDPVAERATRSLDAEELGRELYTAIVGLLDERRARIVVRAATGTRLKTIAEQEGVSVSWARWLLSYGLADLFRARGALSDVVDIDNGFDMLHWIRHSPLRDAHGQADESTCRQCRQPVQASELGWRGEFRIGVPGRPREYCSNACRQRAYRRRRADAAAASADT